VKVQIFHKIPFGLRYFAVVKWTMRIHQLAALTREAPLLCGRSHRSKQRNGYPQEQHSVERTLRIPRNYRHFGSLKQESSLAFFSP
jgi:hypothetical protein